ncbi:acyl-CoA carboxylase subunit beta [Actinomadura fulvescens]|uniref:Acyl-CoA carboxylase subunit beta n=1 Tax=Actinomadura fulvescens TaxID=46160 RepID=A0ABN3PZN5_9ACTN
MRKEPKRPPPRDWPGVIGTAARLTHLARAKERNRNVAPAEAAQHARGKLTARERLTLLLDEDSFVEIDQLRRHQAYGMGMEKRRPPSDGVITGWGRVNGRKVFVFAHDFSVLGGSLGATFAKKIHKVQDLAMLAGAPMIGINDGAGARIQEGVNALAGYGGIFTRNVRASGIIPQISLMAGPCAGGAAYSPALTDFVVMVADIANMFVTGPDVVRAVSGEEVTTEQLGGASVHGRKSGVAQLIARDEKDGIAIVRELLGYLPANSRERPPRRMTTDAADRPCPRLSELVPAEPRKAYDVKHVIREMVDDGEFLEISDRWARNIVCAFAHLDGYAVGIVANQPSVMAGTLNIAAAEKAARFVRTCDTFNIPLVTLVDVPGFLPGTAQEHDGLIRRGAKLLYAYCDASVPRVSVILRKAYGGAYIVMDSKSVGSDFSFAWPTNEVAVMGSQAAVEVIHAKELRASDDPATRRSELVSAYETQLMSPYLCAEQGHVDDVIDPAETRTVLIRTLDVLRDKNAVRPLRKHGNIPL